MQVASPTRRLAFHIGRAAILIGILVLIHFKHRQFLALHRDDSLSRVTLAEVQAIVPRTAAIAPPGIQDSREFYDADGKMIGSVIVTSPAGDQSIGFSGPTNVLIAYDPATRIIGLAILASRDTREHVAKVRSDSRFLAQYSGLSLNEAARKTHVDAVSGATLTSDAIAEAIVHRLGSISASIKFSEPVTLAEIQALFPKGSRFEPDRDEVEIAYVYDAAGKRLGSCLRTAPAGDQKIGYQGPTEGLIGMDPAARIVGIILRKSYDNAEYVSTVREDDYFRQMFNGRSLAELAKMNPRPPDVEGVSGSTMTSLAVAEALVAAAIQNQRPRQAVSQSTAGFPLADMGVIAIIVCGVAISLSRLRGLKYVRWIWPVIVIAYLGFVTGTLLSQAQAVGWAQSGVPHGAIGLIALSGAALALPLTTKRNVYCTHLCPHGAAQQLIQLTLHPQRKIGKNLRIVLAWIPGVLLLVVLAVAMCHLPVSLVDLEPFDAYVPAIAGAVAIAIALIGLVASCFVPMAYCRFGCPTGTVLNFLRRNQQSDRVTRRDIIAILLMVAAGLAWFFG